MPLSDPTSRGTVRCAPAEALARIYENEQVAFRYNLPSSATRGGLFAAPAAARPPAGGTPVKVFRSSHRDYSAFRQYAHKTHSIDRWRHFEDIELALDEDARLVCIVGANGTGKSHLPELIAACAHRLGLSPGVEIPRGDPFGDPHSFSLTLFLAKGVSAAVDPGLEATARFAEWDRSLTITSSTLSGEGQRVNAGGIVSEAQSIQFAREVIMRLQQSQSVHFLSLDADRAYPKRLSIRTKLRRPMTSTGRAPSTRAGAPSRPRRCCTTSGQSTFLRRRISPARGS